ncbi:dihydropteroate synthase [Runella slithyformis]|uniref:dihydropteroate synthase n=1 Tax=Runella slithyformis (strain ATCC 29530 / DSM 19594 / LMG 11500 / NCIMB 11436 / LSU 4) TaxID=761193 RepID=A0A7U4E8R2_RUNSL|nr:dihydropteroate synthase [Runella slithyformis]AEI51714.1 dihydropteroate synthase [Runella slithyformis DSM 19594]
MKKTLNIGGKLLDLSTPQVMGILNITPDSFYSESRVTQLEEAYKKAERMLSEGASILDLGGHSTRPGADAVSEEEETGRILPVVEMLRKHFPNAVLSIDTFRASVARKAVKAGAHIINDIAGGNLDSRMFETVAFLKVPYILMHSRGTPQTMKDLNQYDDLVTDVLRELQAKIDQLQQLGVKDIVADMGFGFAKNADQNYVLLNALQSFQVLNVPILAGVSRKSMIWRKLDITPDKSLNGTTVLNTVALLNGAGILRVHDVKEAVEAVKLVGLLRREC